MCSDDSWSASRFPAKSFYGCHYRSGSSWLHSTVVAGRHQRRKHRATGSLTGAKSQPNDCATNTWTLSANAPRRPELACTFNRPSRRVIFTSSDGGYTNVAATPPTVSCSAVLLQMYTVGGTITGSTPPDR